MFNRSERKGFSQTLLILFLLSAFFLVGCVGYKITREVSTVTKAKDLDAKSPFLKLHLIDGYVWTLSTWQVDEHLNAVIGRGELRDVNRLVVRTGQDTISFSQIALFETNRIQTSPAVAAMGLMTAGTLGLGIYCAANPDACFGSILGLTKEAAGR